MNAKASPAEVKALATPRQGLSGLGRIQEVVTRLDDVPVGVLMTSVAGEMPLSDQRRIDAVVISVSPGFAIGLFAEEQFGSALMFDIITQAQGIGTVVTPRSATREVIRLVYEGETLASESQATDSTSIEVLIRSLIDDAAERKASDIHIETRDTHADVYFRVNGERVFVSNWPYDTAKGIGQVLYGVNADVQSKKVGWDIYQVSECSIDWPTSRNERLQLRFSSSPIFPANNFHIVIRLMSTRAQPRALSALGYAKTQISALDNFTNGSGGMVLMVGPTNSGKSTTMQSMIARLLEVRGRNTKVITVEDPVELVIPGACQISVGRQRTNVGSADDTAFTSFLRGSLRQDPDVVLVGEIRDKDSASIACDLALAGRKVFTTLHANSALWAFSRLREMGVRPGLLTMPGFIAGICYQKLIPTLCQHCAVPDAAVAGEDQLHDFVLANLDAESNIQRRGKGCFHCNGTGVSGRTLVAELMTPNRILLAALASDDLANAEALWVKGHGNPSAAEGIVTAHDHLVTKILAGTVSLQDAKSSIGVSDEYHYRKV